MPRTPSPAALTLALSQGERGPKAVLFAKIRHTPVLPPSLVQGSNL